MAKILTHRTPATFSTCIILPIRPTVLPKKPTNPQNTCASPLSNRRTMTNTSRLRSLDIHNINPHVKEAKYAVRGELAVRAEKYRAQLANSQSQKQQASHHENGTQVNGASSHDNDLPFDSVIAANIGNPQQLDQRPITFFRQVASLLENPVLLEQEDMLVKGFGYQRDVVERARGLLKDVKSVGAYSQSQGAPGIRQSVAKFIERRDGFPSDPSSIYLTAGASAGVNSLMNIVCSSPSTGVLVPIPQYPLYTATLALLNAHAVPYNLNEPAAWSTSLSTIRTSLEKARSEGTDVRALVVINPGNPTGASLSADDIRGIIELAADEKLVLLADEVYQTNVFEGTFYSFKRALRELQSSDPSGSRFANVELASLHSVSKGMVGECGHRGGYMELVGFDPQVVEQLYKFVSIQLCPPVIGQCFVEMMVNPPKPGDPSYPLYHEEYNGIFEGLRDRATALYEAFQAMEGVECQPPQGAMYLFPRLKVPPRAVEAAKKEGRAPDEFYVSRMLDATGVCMVPGSGFGQEEGTAHFRTTFLAPGTEWVGRIRRFHEGFMKEFA